LNRKMGSSRGREHALDSLTALLLSSLVIIGQSALYVLLIRAVSLTFSVVLCLPQYRFRVTGPYTLHTRIFSAFAGLFFVCLIVLDTTTQTHCRDP
jgi:hypothetical protein